MASIVDLPPDDKSNSPRRIQRKRTKGWRMPEGAVYVGRPTKWGNPFRVGEKIRAVATDVRWPYIAATVPGGARGFVALIPLGAEQCVDLYSSWVIEQPYLFLSIQEELGGRDLACWCPLDQPCHADWLLEMAHELADDR